jgi:hypothetical protein
MATASFAPRDARANQVTRCVETPVKTVARLTPTAVIAVMIASATKAAIKPYSIAVTPFSDFILRYSDIGLYARSITHSFCFYFIDLDIKL